MTADTRELLRSIVAVLVSLAMIGVGITHFTNPGPFVKIMPEVLPAKLELVWISGAIEILLGLLLLPKTTRRFAALNLVLLFIAVFPANINMAVNEIQLDPENPLPVWAMWARLPLQFVLIAIAIWLSRSSVSRQPPPL